MLVQYSYTTMMVRKLINMHTHAFVINSVMGLSVGGGGPEGPEHVRRHAWAHPDIIVLLLVTLSKYFNLD